MTSATDCGSAPLGTMKSTSKGVATPASLSSALAFATSLKQAEAGEYEAYLLDWSGRSDPDGNVYSFYKCKAPLNYTGLCNAEVDKLLDESRIPSDRAQRKAIYEKLTRLLLDNESIIYLDHRRVLIAHTARLEGYRQLPDGMVRVIGLTLN